MTKREITDFVDGLTARQRTELGHILNHQKQIVEDEDSVANISGLLKIELEDRWPTDFETLIQAKRAMRREMAEASAN